MMGARSATSVVIHMVVVKVGDMMQHRAGTVPQHVRYGGYDIKDEVSQIVDVGLWDIIIREIRENG